MLCSPALSTCTSQFWKLLFCMVPLRLMESLAAQGCDFRLVLWSWHIQGPIPLPSSSQANINQVPGSGDKLLDMPTNYCNNKQCFDSQPGGNTQSEICRNCHLSPHVTKENAPIRDAFVILAQPNFLATVHQIWLRMPEANDMIERLLFSMDQRQATVKMWPRTWVVLQRGFIS
jgi:hypothetical protein